MCRLIYFFLERGGGGGFGEEGCYLCQIRRKPSAVAFLGQNMFVFSGFLCPILLCPSYSFPLRSFVLGMILRSASISRHDLVLLDFKQSCEQDQTSSMAVCSVEGSLGREGVRLLPSGGGRLLAHSCPGGKGKGKGVHDR